MSNMHLARKIRKVNCLIRKEINNSDFILSNPVMTNAKGYIIGFINTKHLQGLKVYQKDIEQEFHIGKSSATEMLQIMENDGYISRLEDKHDKRKKEIILLDSAKELLGGLDNTITRINEKALEGFNEEEKENLEKYLLRIIDNLGGGSNV